MNDVVQKLEEHINSFEMDFKNVQIEESANFAKEALFAKQALMNNNYLLQVARNNQQSLKDAILNIAAIGLTLNPSRKMAYLVPRNGKVCLDVSYLGLVKAATDSGSILWAKPVLVYEKDEFSIDSIQKEPIHKRNPFCKDRGALLGCYVTAKTREGDFLTETMTIEEILKVRDMSETWKNEKARKYSPWHPERFETEMIKKTVIKRAYKHWPKTEKSYLLENAVEESNKANPIDFENEKSDLELWEEKDREQNPDAYIVGDAFIMRNGKFRGKKLGEIPTEELVDYYDLLEQRINKSEKPKGWELELKATISEYLGDIE